MPTPVRVRVDACPGVLAPHDAADGALARVRLPGGQVDAAALWVLAACAEDLGDGKIHLTSRGNLQLRGLDRSDPELERRLTGCGLLPSRTHERVRNVLASPLSGIAGGLADVRELAPALDRALCARPELAGLSGRFLFALDDGRGDVAAEQPDLCWQALDAATGTLVVAGTETGVTARTEDAVALLVRAATTFLQVRGSAWRAIELPEADRARLAGPSAPTRGAIRPDSRVLPSRLAGVGPVRRADGGTALAVAPVLGELTAAQLLVLADAAQRVVVTPWRSIVLPTADAAARLAAAGLVVDPASPAPLLSACAGRPGCAKALADVRADARTALPLIHRRTHVSGCERRCGAPHAPHVDAVALADGGYLIDGERQDGL
ncbi:precorrin-3B synthase [Pseudonocardia sp. GCM10023141]|uniref:precorrin-3B synthase n=1 Tax=Pseudonocardia sp. GCM10023141 TaxID=3252653 RepID=UPI003610A719